MPVTLTRGTKEPVRVQVTDLSAQISDLSGASPHFDVEDDTGTKIVDNAAATAVGMLIACVCDTTSWSSSLQHLNLYVKFTIGGTIPRLGPYDIYLIGQ
jgi:hypothetical protein